MPDPVPLSDADLRMIGALCVDELRRGGCAASPLVTKLLSLMLDELWRRQSLAAATAADRAKLGLDRPEWLYDPD